jgi:hypothetical protein
MGWRWRLVQSYRSAHSEWVHGTRAFHMVRRGGVGRLWSSDAAGKWMGSASEIRLAVDYTPVSRINGMRLLSELLAYLIEGI